MDEMLITGARRAPAAIINMVESTDNSYIDTSAYL
jgi:hypothetical protein